MALSRAQAFTQFLEGLTTTDFQKTLIIRGRKKTVDDRLFEKLRGTSDMPYSKGIFMGSATKGTVIRPFDYVDSLAVFSNAWNAGAKYQWDSKSNQWFSTRNETLTYHLAPVVRLAKV